MKKYIALAIAGFIAVILTACGTNDEKESKTTLGPETTSVPYVAPELSEADLEIQLIDALFPQFEADICVPEANLLSDEQIVAEFEAGYGKPLQPEAAAHLVHLVRACS